MAMPVWCGSLNHVGNSDAAWEFSRHENNHTHDRPPAHETAISDADRALLDRLVGGDAEALVTLVHRYSVSLEGYALSLIKTSDLASDIVQDVFVRVWERRQTLDVHRSLASYLHRMVRYRALDLLRHEQVRVRAERALRLHVERERATTQNEGAQRLDEDEFWARVAEAVGTLQPRCREIFQLHREHGLSYGEIAELLGISLPTVYNQMAKATKRLAEYLAM